jgi:hypothetical protein
MSGQSNGINVVEVTLFAIEVAPVSTFAACGLVHRDISRTPFSLIRLQKQEFTVSLNCPHGDLLVPANSRGLSG